MRARALLLVSLFLLPAACGREGPGSGVAAARARGRLVVLTEVGFPYFGMRDERGELTGFDVDLAREMGKDLGLPVEFRDRQFDLLFGELQRGAGDVVVSGVTVTESRKQEVDFSAPYFLTRTLALLARPRADDVKILDDLDAPNRRLVAKSGTTGHEAAKKRFPRASFYTLDQENLCALEVAQGRADAFVYDEVQVRLYAREHAGTTRVLEEQVTVEPYAVACREGDRETVEWVDGFLARARKDGRIDALIRRHLPGIEPPPRDG